MARLFDGVDFSVATPEPWEFAAGEVLGDGFRCLRGEFASYWKRGRVERECKALIARAFVLRVDGRLAAYMTLFTDKLHAGEPLLEAQQIRYRTFPAVKIGLLAADERARGAGTRLVKWALGYSAFEIGARAGVRFVTVDALYDVDTGFDASPFYEKLGFRFATPTESTPPTDGYRTMYYDLQPVYAAI
jgi:GNAT superfamily N-acetyltransferase